METSGLGILNQVKHISGTPEVIVSESAVQLSGAESGFRLRSDSYRFSA